MKKDFLSTLLLTFICAFLMFSVMGIYRFISTKNQRKKDLSGHGSLISINEIITENPHYLRLYLV